jgi:amino acid permease
MSTLKKINGILYFIVLTGLILKFLDDAVHTNLFTFISGTVYWNFAFWLFTIFFILSCISLFKKELVFKYVPYFFYVLYVLIFIASFIVNSKEDL